MAIESSSHDPDALDRFVTAQDGLYGKALSELQRGYKSSHWMWFIFPQLRGLGRSSMSHFYGISGLDEARRYLSHPILGPRLDACTQALLSHAGTSAETIMGVVDAGKLRSCATLFDVVDNGSGRFDIVIRDFFDGRPCPITTERLASSNPQANQP